MSAAFVMILFAFCSFLQCRFPWRLRRPVFCPAFDASFTASATYCPCNVQCAEQLSHAGSALHPVRYPDGQGRHFPPSFRSFSYLIGKRTAGSCAVIVTCLFTERSQGRCCHCGSCRQHDPPILRLGYEKKFCVAIIAVQEVWASLSAVFLSYVRPGLGKSVSDLFTAGIIPGILIALLLMVYAVYHSKKHGEDKEKIAGISTNCAAEALSCHEEASWRPLTGHHSGQYLQWNRLSYGGGSSLFLCPPDQSGRLQGDQTPSSTAFSWAVGTYAHPLYHGSGHRILKS